MMKRLTTVVAVVALAGTAFAQEKKAPDAKPADTAAKGEKKAPDAKPAGSAAGSAAPAVKMEPVKPAAELEQLKPFVKSWSCTGTATFPLPSGPVTINTKSTVSGKWDLGNHFAFFKYSRSKTKEVPAFNATGYWGYDGGQKKYVFFGPDDQGGILNLTAGAPMNDTLEWSGTASMMGQSLPVKFTVAVDQKAKKMHMTIEGPNAVKLLDDDCK